MKTLAGSAFVLLFLCGPALADPAAAEPGAPRAPRAQPASLNIHFVVHTSTATRTYDVIVASDHRCASSIEKLPDHQDEIKVCASDESHLDIDWITRGSSSEYRNKASLVLARGATAELGSGNGPRLGVTIQ
jgi:hypothetical protein